MKTKKRMSYKKLLKKEIKDKKFKKEYDELEKAFIIAKEVIKYRKKMNMTQKELAKKAKTSQSAISRLESGEYKSLTLSSLYRLANALNAQLEIHIKS